MPTEKVYTLRLEMGQTQQQLDQATKALAELKTNAQAANQEQKEAKATYDSNARALRELVSQQKQLAQAQKAAAPGDAWAKATAALEKNAQQQATLNSILAESRLDYEAQQKAAEAASQAVGEQAATVQELAASVKDYKAQAEQAAKTFAPGTFGAIGQEVEQLKQELQHLGEGSAEAAAKIQQIADKESKLRGAAQAMQALNPEAQAKAFGILSGALVGATAAATAVAQTFGLSEQTAEQYTQRMQQLTGVLASVDAVTKLVSGENLSLVKGIWNSAKAWAGFGASAEAAAVAAVEAGAAAEAAGTATASGAEVAAAGLTASGVGAIIVGLGLALGVVITLWQRFGSAGAEAGDKTVSTWTKVKAETLGTLSAIWDGYKSYTKGFFQLLTGDFDGFKATLKNSLSDMLKAYQEAHDNAMSAPIRERLAHEAEVTERLLSVLRARGVDTLKLEVENARRIMAAQEAHSKASLDATRDYVALKEQLEKRARDEQEAETLAHLNRLLALEQAAGRSTYQTQLALEEEKLTALLAARKRGELVSQAQITAQQTAIAALQVAHQKDVNDRLFALHMAGLDGRIAIEQQKGEDAYQLQLRQANRRIAQLRAAGIQDGAAIRKAEDDKALLILTHDQALAEKQRQEQLYNNALAIADLEKQGRDTLSLRLQQAEQLLAGDRDGTEKEKAQKREDYQALLALEAEYNARVREGEEANREQREELYQQYRQADANFLKGVGDYVSKAVNDSKKKFNLGAAILTDLFGVKPEDVEKVKAELSQAFGEISQATSNLATTYLAAANQAVDAELQAVQDRLQQVGDHLSQASSRRQQDEEKIASATGSRRQWLISQVEAERKAEAGLAAEKKKAADEQAAAAKKKAELDKAQQRITAATTAAEAVGASVRAIESAAAIPFPLNIPAVFAAVASVATAVASARSLAQQFEAGGVVGPDGVLRGPRHAQGGIPFTIGGQPGFEAEGGEHLTPVDASARNAAALALIRTQGRTRTLGALDYMRALGEQAASVQRVPPPQSYFEPGGVLNRGAAPGSGRAAGDAGEQRQTNALLSQLVVNSATTATATSATAAHAATTAEHAATTAKATTASASYGPARLAIGHREIQQLREEEKGMQQAKDAVTL